MMKQESVPRVRRVRRAAMLGISTDRLLKYFGFHIHIFDKAVVGVPGISKGSIKTLVGV